MTQNGFNKFKVKSTHMNTAYTYKVQFFIWFALQEAAFVLRPNLKKGAPKDPKNNLAMFKVKRTHMHATYVQKVQICIRFALQWIIDVSPK